MKILMVVFNNFFNDSRVDSEARALAENGYHVSVVDCAMGTGREEKKTVDSITVYRVQTDDRPKVMNRRSIRIPLFWKAVKKMSKHIDFDVIHCHDLDTLSIGMSLKKERNITLIYDAHEIYPYVLNRGWAKLVKPYSNFLERKGVKTVDHLIMAEETYDPYFSQLGYKKSITVLNCKDIRHRAYRPPSKKEFTLSYIGTLSRPRFILELIDVVAHMEGVHLIIAGSGPLTSEVRKRSKFLNNVEFLGLIPSRDVIPLTMESHGVVCMIDPRDMNNRIASANKQFEAMVAGRPIITTQGTRSGQITEKETCGLVVAYNREALKKAIGQLRDNSKLCEKLGRNGLKAALNKYNWSNEKKKLLALYSSLSK